ncbi:MAG TPA: AsmA family protein [Candidatus Polarisedimenticolia bacterium]|nr:AsmA family protein [Candidatus Polarisedimenticolia bacterium]
MPLARWTFKILMLFAALAAILVGGVLALPHLVDVNRYRPQIAARLEEAAGRSVSLGTLTLSLLPAPGLAARTPVLAESTRYPGRDFLQAESLALRVGLLDLLRGRVTVKSIVLNRPVLTLIRDEGGRWNFDDLLRRASTPGSKGAAPSGEGPPLRIDRVIVHDGRVRVYDDAVVPGARSEVVIAPVEARVGGWGGGADTEIDLSAGLGKSRVTTSARLIAADGRSRLEGRTTAKGLRAVDLATLIPWLGVARPGGLELGGTIDLQGAATLPLDRPQAVRFKGTLRLKGLSYRDAGMARPLQDLSGTVTVDDQRASCEDFGARIGGSALHGRLQVEDFLRPRIGFTLTSPRIDFNEALATFAVAVPTTRSAKPLSAATTAFGGGLLEQIKAAGSLTVEAARFETFDLSKAGTAVGLERGLFSLKETKAAFYGGTLVGRASADLSRGKPVFNLGIKLDGVDVNPTLTAYDAGLENLLGGTLAGTLDLEATGADMQGMLRTARGSAALEVTKGRIASFSLLKQLAALLELAGGKGIGRDETPFEFLRAHLSIADGKARTDDLTLHSADLDLDGKGWIGLDATLDLDVAASFSEESTRGMVARNARLGSLADSRGRLTMRFRLSGDLKSPRFAIDTRAQAGAVKEKARQKVRDLLLDRLRKNQGHEGAPPPPP